MNSTPANHTSVSAPGAVPSRAAGASLHATGYSRKLADQPKVTGSRSAPPFRRHPPARLLAHACAHLNAIITRRGVTDILTAEDRLARRYRAFNTVALRLAPLSRRTDDTTQEPTP
jgi:hypothetical protein